MAGRLKKAVSVLIAVSCGGSAAGHCFCGGDGEPGDILVGKNSQTEPGGGDDHIP